MLTLRWQRAGRHLPVPAAGQQARPSPPVDESEGRPARLPLQQWGGRCDPHQLVPQAVQVGFKGYQWMLWKFKICNITIYTAISPGLEITDIRFIFLDLSLWEKIYQAETFQFGAGRPPSCATCRTRNSLPTTTTSCQNTSWALTEGVDPNHSSTRKYRGIGNNPHLNSVLTLSLRSFVILIS